MNTVIRELTVEWGKRLVKKQLRCSNIVLMEACAVRVVGNTGKENIDVGQTGGKGLEVDCQRLWVTWNMIGSRISYWTGNEKTQHIIPAL